MFRFVVVDMPQVGAATLVLVIVALLYFMYRDIRMLVQMVLDMREEMMITQMSSGDTNSDSEDAENTHSDNTPTPPLESQASTDGGDRDQDREGDREPPIQARLAESEQASATTPPHEPS